MKLFDEWLEKSTIIARFNKLLHDVAGALSGVSTVQNTMAHRIIALANENTALKEEIQHLQSNQAEIFSHITQLAQVLKRRDVSGIEFPKLGFEGKKPGEGAKN